MLNQRDGNGYGYFSARMNFDVYGGYHSGHRVRGVLPIFTHLLFARRGDFESEA